MPGNPDMALASMGIYVFNTKFLIEQLDRDAADAEIEPRLRQGHHSLSRQARRRRVGASLRRGPACVRPRRRQSIGATSGRSTPTGRPTSTSPTSCRISISTTQTGRSGPIGEITPPAKFVHDVDGRRGSGAVIARLGRLHHLRLPRSALPAVHRRARPFVLQRSRTRWSCRTCEIGRGCASRERRHRPRRQHSRGPGGRRGPGAGRPALPPHSRRASVSSPRTMIDRLAALSRRPMSDDVRVLSVASEVYPLIKTGGLADVAGALPGALAREGVEMQHAAARVSRSAGRSEGGGAGRIRLRDLHGRPGARAVGDCRGSRPLRARRAASLCSPGRPLCRRPAAPNGLTTAVRFAALARVGADIGRGLLPGWRSRHRPLPRLAGRPGAGLSALWRMGRDRRRS